MYKVYIRPLAINDAEYSYKWRNDPEVWKFTGSRPNRVITYEIEKEWIEKVLNDNSCRRFAIMADNTYVGNIQLTDISESAAEYHIFIGDKSWWGKGISNLATYQILHFAKEELKLKEVYLSVREDNIPAVKSYLKNSFTEKDNEDGWKKMVCNLDRLPVPTVSVFVMVYNHEKYLRECLDGVLMQRCNFTFNVVVGEDCSTDGSREILLEYQLKYPGKFKLLLHEQNIGASANQKAVLAACRGIYIAMCEGDDYWTDPLKLQKQVDFLEKNRDFNFSMGRVDMLIEKTGEIKKRKEHVNPDVNETYTLKDYITSPFSQTSSFLFRNDGVAFPPWFHNVHAADQSLVIVKTGVYGKIKYHKELFSIYRINDGSISHTKSAQLIYKNFDKTLGKWDEHLDNKYGEEIMKRKYKNLIDWRYAKLSNPWRKILHKTLVHFFLIQ